MSGVAEYRGDTTSIDPEMRSDGQPSQRAHRLAPSVIDQQHPLDADGEVRRSLLPSGGDTVAGQLGSEPLIAVYQSATAAATTVAPTKPGRPPPAT